MQVQYARSTGLADTTQAQPLSYEGTSLLAFAQRGMHRYTLLSVLLIAFVGLVTFAAPTDPDVWWHLRNGQLILDTGAVPTHDVYSFTAQGRPWLVQEWLTEVLMYGLKSVFGYSVLSLLFGVLQAVGAGIVYGLARRMNAGRLPALVVLMLYAVFAAPTWGVRPQVLTPVFLGLFLWALLSYREEPSRTRSLWALPALMLLWANMHASFFMGIALVGAFLVGEAANNFVYRPVRPTPLRPLLLVLLACFAATLANPYFLELWTYPLTYALHGTSNPLLRYTQEWQSPNFHEPGNLLFGLSLILLVLVGIARPVREHDRDGWRFGLLRRVDVTQAILLVAFSVLALQAVRLVPLYGLVALPLLAGALAQLWPAFSSRDETEPEGIEARLNPVVAVLGIVGLAYFVFSLPQAQTASEPRTDTTYVYPLGAATYLSRFDRPVRMYNEFAWGGYLISRLYPQQHVFIDGRADMYREGIFDDYMVVQNTSPGWREILTRYNVDLIVVPPDRPIAYAIAHEPGWRVTFKDHTSVVYEKSVAGNR